MTKFLLLVAAALLLGTCSVADLAPNKQATEVAQNATATVSVNKPVKHKSAKHSHPAKKPASTAAPANKPKVPQPVRPVVEPASVQKEGSSMLSNALNAVVSWLLGLSLANALVLGFVAWYVLKNGTAPALATAKGAWGKVSGAATVVKVDVAAVVTGINSRVSALESDVAGIKAALAPKAAAPAAPAVSPAHVAAPAAVEPAKA